MEGGDACRVLGGLLDQTPVKSGRVPSIAVYEGMGRVLRGQVVEPSVSNSVEEAD